MRKTGSKWIQIYSNHPRAKMSIRPITPPPSIVCRKREFGPLGQCGVSTDDVKCSMWNEQTSRTSHAKSRAIWIENPRSAHVATSIACVHHDPMHIRFSLFARLLNRNSTQVFQLKSKVLRVFQPLMVRRYGWVLRWWWLRLGAIIHFSIIPRPCAHVSGKIQTIDRQLKRGPQKNLTKKW
jgi:hypothetical protein